MLRLQLMTIGFGCATAPWYTKTIHGMTVLLCIQVYYSAGVDGWSIGVRNNLSYHVDAGCVVSIIFARDLFGDVITEGDYSTLPLPLQYIFGFNDEFLNAFEENPLFHNLKRPGENSFLNLQAMIRVIPLRIIILLK